MAQKKKSSWSSRFKRVSEGAEREYSAPLSKPVETPKGHTLKPGEALNISIPRGYFEAREAEKQNLAAKYQTNAGRTTAQQWQDLADHTQKRMTEVSKKAGTNNVVNLEVTKELDTLRKARDHARKAADNARKVEASEKYSSYYGKRDFETKAAEGAKQENNVVQYVKDNWEKITATGNVGPTVGNKAAKNAKLVYRNMTASEVKLYNYILATDGEEDANKYLDSIMDELNYREGSAQYERLSSNNDKAGIQGVGETIATGLYGLTAGVDQWKSGVEQMFSNELQPTSAQQYGSMMVQADLADTPGWNRVYQATVTVGNMLPSIILSRGIAGRAGMFGHASTNVGRAALANVGKNVGAAAMGLGASGNAYAQAIKEGYSEEQARAYGVLVGASEALLERFLGGIGSLSGQPGEQLLKKMIGTDTAFKRFIGSFVGSNVSEMFEETLQSYLEPAFATLLTGEEYDAPTAQEFWDTIFITLMSTTAIGGGRIYAETVGQDSEGNAIVSPAELVKYAAEQVKNKFKAPKQTKTADNSTVSPAASAEAQQVNVASNAVAASNPKSTVLNAATTLLMEKQGLDLKTATKRAEIIQKLVDGVDMKPADFIKMVNRLDPKNPTTQAIFTELTGVVFPENKGSVEVMYNTYRSAHDVMLQKVEENNTPAPASLNVETAEPVTEAARDVNSMSAAEVLAAARESRTSEQLEAADVQAAAMMGNLAENGAPRLRYKDFVEAKTARDPEFATLSEEQKQDVYRDYLVKSETIETRDGPLTYQEYVERIENAPVAEKPSREEIDAKWREEVEAQKHRAQNREEHRDAVEEKTEKKESKIPANLTGTQRAMVDKWGKVLKSYGLKVEWDDSLLEGEPGRRTGNTIQLNPRMLTTEEAVARIVAHEMVHGIKNGVVKKKMVDDIISVLHPESASLDDIINKYIRDYQEHEDEIHRRALEAGKTDHKRVVVTPEYAREEYAGDLMRRTFTDDSLRQKLARSRPGKINEILNWIEKVASRFTGQDRDEVYQLRQRFVDALGTNKKAATTEDSAPRSALVSLSEAAGLEIRRNAETGRVEFWSDGHRVAKVTTRHVKNSGLGALITCAATKIEGKPATITKAEADKQYAAVAEIMNMIQETQDPELVWSWVGAAMFSAVKSNSDPQYGTTIDFTTVCRKTQDMITAMSEAMVRLGRGLTKAEVTQLQKELIGDKLNVPCPVCYVFSRWAGVGSILDNMNRWQERYDDFTPEQLQERIELLTEKLDGKKKDLREMLQELDDEYDSLDREQEKNKLEKPQLKKRLKEALKKNDAVAASELQARISAIEAREPQIKKRLDDIEKSVAPELSWLMSVRTDPEYAEKGKVPPDILFNLDEGATFASRYPVAWGYRTTRGPSAGKAILPYSDMRLGDLILGVKNTSADGNTTFAETSGEFTKAQYNAVVKAIARTRAQNLIGGQRFQSTSDFRYDYALDYIMAFFEAQAIGSKMQTYTKIIEFADMVAAVHGDVNLSVMPKDKGYIELDDGTKKLIFSDVTGINFEAAKRANAMHDNAQLILVGINDEHILTALDESVETNGYYIGFVIPYHASGASINEFISALVSNLGEDFNVKYYQDYSKVQTDSVKDDATDVQRRRNELRTLLLKGKEGSKSWSPKPDDIKFIKGESVDISGRSFEDLRNVELKALRGEPEAIKEYESWTAGNLQKLYEKLWVSGPEKGVRLSSQQAGPVMPHEYWNKNVDRAHAYINGFLFRSYCYNLGLKPRFTGLTEGGVYYGDFSTSKGYWKTLIDRPMYRNDGTYRDQEVVNVTEFQKEMLHPDYAKENWGEFAVAEPNREKAKQVGAKFAESRYALNMAEDQDSIGFTLSEQQKKFFKNSKAVDSRGRLKLMFHGTEQFGFTIFDPAKSDDRRSLFFTDSIPVARTYTPNKEAGLRLVQRNFDPSIAEEKDFRYTPESKKEAAEYLQKLGWETAGKKLTKKEIETASLNYARQTAREFRNWYDALEDVVDAPMFVKWLQTQSRASSVIAEAVEATRGTDATAAMWAVRKAVREMNFVKARAEELLGWSLDEEQFEGVMTMLEALEDHQFAVRHYISALQTEGPVVEYNAPMYGSIPMSDESIVTDASEENNRIRTGVYMVHLNLENPLIIDANFHNWNDLDYDDVYADNANGVSNETRWEGSDTRDIAEWAEEHGYDGVIFRNLIDIAGLSELDNYDEDAPSTVMIAFKPEQVKSAANKEPTNDPDIRYALVEDPAKIEELENQEHLTVYKAMVKIGDNYYPPMASEEYVDEEYTDKKGDKKTRSVRKLKNPSILGRWQESVENPGMITKFMPPSKEHPEGYGQIKLLKSNKDDIPAAYNPYEHTSSIVLNDQFTTAYKRPELVTVEYRIPVSELTSGYKAQYAKDPVGLTDWKAGGVAQKLQNTHRDVYLTRWSKPVRELSDAEVAQKYKEIMDKEPEVIKIPWNVVTESLRHELEKVGVAIDYSDASIGSNVFKFEDAFPADYAKLPDSLKQEAAAESDRKAEERRIKAEKKAAKKAKKSEGVRYALNSDSEWFTRSFAEQIDSYKAGNIGAYDTLVVGPTPKVFQQIGLNALPMTYGTGHLSDVLNGMKEDHDFGEEVLKLLPKALQKPVAIIASKTQPSSSVVALVELSHAGKRLLTAVHVDGRGQVNGLQIDSNALTTAHKRSNAVKMLSDAVQNDSESNIKVFYVDKEKTTRWLNRSGLQLPGQLNAPSGVVHSIHDAGSPVKPKLNSVLETTQFKNWFGDWQNKPKAASKIVNRDGSPAVVYHGTNAKFDRFKTGDVGIHVGSTRSQAEIRVRDSGEKGHVMELYANIRNPLYAAFDFGDWNGNYVAELLIETDQFEEFDNRAEIEAKLREISEMDKESSNVALREYLQELGYDGIAYENQFEVEDRYSGYNPYSFIVFNPNQLKSIHNVGTFSPDTDHVRYALTPEFEDWYREEFGIKKDTKISEKQLQRRLERQQKRIEDAENEKKAAAIIRRAKEDNAALANEMHEKRKLGQQKQKYEQKIRDMKAQHKEQLADQRLADEMHYKRVGAAEVQEWKQKLKDLDEHRKEQLADQKQLEDMYRSRKLGEAATRLRVQKDSYTGKIAKLKENMKLRSNAAKAVLRDKARADKKRAEIEKELGPIDTLRKNPKERAAEQKKKTFIEQLKYAGRTFLFEMENQGIEVDRFSKRQISDVLAGDVLTLMGGTSSTVEYIYKTGLVGRSGDRLKVNGKELGSMKEVFLCLNESGKHKGQVNESMQAVLQDYILHLHNIDSMSFVEKAEAALVAFETAHPEMKKLSGEGLALLVNQSDAATEKAGNGEIRELAREYLELLRRRINAKNKAIWGDKDGNDVTADFSRQRVEQLRKEAPWVVEKADAIFEWWDAFMREWAVGDTLSIEQYEVMHEMYPHYAPLFREEEGGPGSPVHVASKSIATKTATTERKGSHKPVKPIEDNFAAQVAKIVRLARTNQLYRNIMDTAILDDGSNFGDMIAFDWEAYGQTGEYAKALKEGAFFNGDLDQHIEDAVTTEVNKEPLGNNKYKYTLHAWYDGKKYSAEISYELYRSLAAVNGSLSNDFVRTLTKAGNTLTGPMKSFITGHAPMFAIRNAFRDAGTAMINTRVVNSISGLAFPQYYAKALNEIKKGQKSQHWQNFIALGGTHATYYRDAVQPSKALTKKRNAVQKGWDAVGTLNEVTESATRFAEYLATVERLGDTYENRIKGIKNAAEITVDFSRKGRTGAVINAWVAYWNPAVQGISKQIRQVIEATEGRTVLKQALMVGGRVVAQQVLLEGLQRMILKLFDRDDDWETLDDRTKDAYYCIPLKDEHKFLKIPKSREWSAILGNNIWRILESANGRADAWENYWETSIEASYLPPSLISITEEGGYETDLFPFSILSDLQNNKDFAGRTIVPTAYKNGTRQNQYDSDTSLIARLASELIDALPVDWGFSPMQVDYFIDNYFGDFGKLITMASSPAVLKGDKTFIGSVADILLDPWVKDNRYSNYDTGAYYDRLEELDRVVQDKKNQLGTEGAEKSREYQIQQAMKDLYGNTINDLNAQARNLPDGPEKDAIKQELADTIAAAVEYYDRAMAGEIENPILDAEYSKCTPSISKELIRLDSYSETYKMGPRDSAPTSLEDPDDDDREYKFDKEQQAKFMEIYYDFYNEMVADEMNSSGYRSSNDEEKAGLLSDIREDANEYAKEEFLAWVKKQGYRSELKKGRS